MIDYSAGKVPPPQRKLTATVAPKSGGGVSFERMNQLVNEKQVETLNLKDLKAFLKDVGCPLLNKNKALLVQDVYDHFQFH